MPTWYDLALKEEGVKERPGSGDNPVVVAYYRDAGHPEVKHDAVAWCAAFMGAMLHRDHYKPSGSLMARSYEHYGSKLVEPKRGCIVVFARGTGGQGHVTFFDHWVDQNHMVCFGGNQMDQVCFETFDKHNVLAYRWPSFNDFVQPERGSRPKGFVVMADTPPVPVPVVYGPSAATTLPTQVFNGKVRAALAASGGALLMRLLMKVGLDAQTTASIVDLVMNAVVAIIPIVAAALWSAAEKKLVHMHIFPTEAQAPQNPPAG